MRLAFPRLTSLTLKFSAISILMIIFLSIYLYTEFAFTRHLEGEATRINLAGNLRFRSYKIALSANKISAAGSAQDKRKLHKELKEEIDAFDRILSSLMDGNKRLGIKPIQYENSVLMLNSINDKWNKNLKPLLIAAEPAKDNQKALFDKYGAMINGYVNEIDNFVKSLTERTENDIKEHSMIRLYILAFFFGANIIVIFIIRNSFIMPIKMLRDATHKVENGGLDVRISVKNRDEIGDLAYSFNSMVQRLKISINEIHNNREQLQSIIDNSTAVIYVKDMQGRFILVNLYFEKLFHINKEKFIGKTDYDIFPKEMADAFRANDKKVIEAGAPIEFEENALHDDGVHTYISIKFLLHDSSGRPYATCGISTDITERKRIEEELKEKTKSLVNAQRIASLGNWEWDIVNNKVYLSDEICRIFGSRPQEFGDTVGFDKIRNN